RDFEATALAVLQGQCAVEELGELVRDRQTQSGATSFAIARAFDAIEGLQYCMHLSDGDAGTGVTHYDRNALLALGGERELRIDTELEGVVHEVGNDPPQSLRPGQERQLAVAARADYLAGVAVVAHNAVEQRIQVGQAELLSDPLPIARVRDAFL